MKSIKGLVLTVFLSLCFIFLFYGKVVKSPNSYLFTAHGDGVKNYYTYNYHIQHDSSYHHFEGMNYPYGELVAFTDGHYALANSVKLLAKYYPGIKDYSIGVLNSAIIWSFLISAIFIYLILVHYQVNQIVSALAAISIMMLAPQVERIEGHLSLSYSFFIPLTWYLLIGYQKKKTFVLIVLFLSQLLFLFTHPYLGVISIFFTLLYAFLFHFKEKKDFLLMTIVSVSTVLLFKVFLSTIDFHLDRPGAPGGFFRYCAQIGSVFQPHYDPLYKPWYHIVAPPKQRWEGWAYIGLGSTLVCIYLLVKGAVSLFKRKGISSLPKEYVLLFVIATLALFYSYGFPYRQGFYFLLEWFGFLKQIRALGRFVWIFYFIITIMSFAVINHAVGNRRKKYALMILLAAFNCFESYTYHDTREEKITRSSNVLKHWEGYPIEASNYEAILPLPFYYVGNENIQLGVDHAVFRESILLSNQTGIPLLSSSLSRTSNVDTRNIVSLFSPLLGRKELSSKLKGGKVLILKSVASLNKYERRLLACSNFLFDQNGYGIYELDLQVYLKQRSEIVANDSLVEVTEKNITFFNDFDDIKTDTSFLRGSYHGLKKEYNIYYEKAHSNQDALDISFWYYVGEDNLSENNMIVEEIDTLTGRKEWTHDFNMVQTFVPMGNWQLIERKYEPNTWVNKIKIFSKASTRKDQRYYLDQLLIKKSGSQVFQKTKEGYWLNNIPLFEVDSLIISKS